jgi:hypothetical protein
MAITDENANASGNTNSGFAAAGSTAPGQSNSSPFSSNSDRGFSLLNMGNVGGIVRSAVSEVLAKGYEAIQNAVKDSRISPAYKIMAMQIDNQQNNKLRLSSIVIVLQHQASGNVAYHTLLLEGSADVTAFQAKIETINGVQVQLDKFASQVYDQIYADAVAKAIMDAFPNSKTLNTGATVVPRTVNWDEREQVRLITQNAMLAAATYLEARLPDFIDFDLSKVSNDAQLQVQISWDNPNTNDFTGQPVRSDIQIISSAVATQRVDSQSLNTGNDSTPISCVTGYMDLSWEPDAQQAMQFAQAQPGSQRKYRPRFIITRLENNVRMTPAAQLLSVASGLCLGEGTTWYRAFQPRRNIPAGVKDKHDIGAINIEANLQGEPGGFGKPIDTKTVQFGDRELGSLLFNLLHQQVAFSIDVSDAGADTWYNSQFARAAAGDPQANTEIFKAANVLTGGAFQKLMGNANFTAMLQTDERVLMGYYTNKDGQREDVRGIDYLTVLNYQAVSNPQAIVDWSQSFQKTDEPQPLRLQGRKTIIRAIAEQVVFTQYATRCTFNPQFLQVLVQAIHACGMAFKLINTGMAGDYMSQRSGGLFANAGFGMASTGIFSANYSGAVAPVFQRPFQPTGMFQGV